MNSNDLELRLNGIQQREQEAISNAGSIISDCEPLIDDVRDLATESECVAKLAHYSEERLLEIERDFVQATSITNKTDMIFLGIATALQCLRWVLLNKLTEKDKAGESDFEKRVKKHYQGTDAQLPTPYYASYEYIIGNKTVPYDAVAGTKTYNVGRNGGLSGNHRYKTLGHDPLLGFVFGTSNILTSTLTNNSFQTFHIMQKGNTVIGNASTATMFSKVAERIVEEPKALGAAVIKQAAHIATDVYTKEGIPLPFVQVFSDEAANFLGKYGIDTGGLLKAGASMKIASMFDSLIAAVHGLCYNENECTSVQYEIRTRKILDTSKLIAEGSNILTSALTQQVDKLDIGGIIYTLWNLIKNIDFIANIKVEYMSSEFNKSIMNPM